MSMLINIYCKSEPVRSTLYEPTTLAWFMVQYTCNKCGVTHRYDASWHKNAPTYCGRCIRLGLNLPNREAPE